MRVRAFLLNIADSLSVENQYFKNFKIMPLTAAAASLISGLASVAGNLGISGLNFLSTQRTNKLAMANAERAFAREQAAIKEQNLYNSPAQQLTRLAAAGLNPQMAYGNGEVVSSTQTQTPDYSVPGLSVPMMDSSAISSGIQSSIAVREQFNKNSLAKSTVALQSAQALLTTTSNELSRVDLDYLCKTFGFRVDSVKASLDLLNQERDINEQTIEKLKIQNKINVEILNQEEWNSLMAEGRFDMLMVELDMRKEEFDQLRKIFPAKLALMNSEQALNWAKSAEARGVITTFASIAERNRSEARLNDARAFEQSQDTYAKDSFGSRRRTYLKNSVVSGNMSLKVGPVSGSEPAYFDVTKGLISTSYDGRFHYGNVR